MRYLMRSLWVVVFVLLLGFAVKNSAEVTVRFYLGTQWQVPLVIVMFLFFLGGAIVALSAALATLMRQRRDIGKLRRALESAKATDARHES